MFVAGTSCKDFSMLKSSHRKGEACNDLSHSVLLILHIKAEFTHNMLCHNTSTDIEDKGTSGETFLAAVEYLEQEQPSVALFENVDNAPWDKMQEYIRGRLNLSERNSIKNITQISKEKASE